MKLFFLVGIQMLGRRWGGGEERERERAVIGDAAKSLRASYKRRV